MPTYDVNRAGWPPDPDSLGGLGLCLDAGRLQTIRADMSEEEASRIPAITTAMAPAPADTALLVECININNALWGTKLACIETTKEQEPRTLDVKKFHGGKFNFLMLDGHVELLSPVEAVGHAGTPGNQARTHYGVWTIRIGD